MNSPSTTAAPSPSIAGRLRGLLLFVVATLVLAEVACRLGALGPDASDVPVTVPDGPYGVHHDRLGWTACPHSPILGTTDLGLRGSMPDAARLDRTFRIACVGDEATWGELVDPEDTWGHQAEMHLRERLAGAVVDSVMAAGIGYSSHQDVLLFERVVAPLAPDVSVLFLTTRNDRTDGAGIGDAQWWAARDELRDSLLGRSRLVRALQRSWNDGWRAPYRRSERPRVTPAELETNVDKLVAAARAGGGTVIVLRPPLDDDDPWGHALDRASARAGVPTIAAPALDDARGIWNTEGGAPKLTRAGHAELGRLAALAILEAADGMTARLRVPHASPSATITTVRPGAVPFARDPAVTISGAGLEGVRALFVGECEIETFSSRDAESMTFTPPRWLSLHPGRHAVTAVTRDGHARSDHALITRPPSIKWKKSTQPGEAGIFTAFAPAYSKIVIWFSTGLLERPVATPFGAFALAGGFDAAEASDRDVWTRIPLLALTVHADRGGRARTVVPKPPPGAPPPPERGWVQALVIWGPRPDDACLSEVTEVNGS